ncbi:hypothetical protein PESHB4_17280 [Pediococcus ethanolidurans]
MKILNGKFRPPLAIINSKKLAAVAIKIVRKVINTEVSPVKVRNWRLINKSAVKVPSPFAPNHNSNAERMVEYVAYTIS